MTDVPEVPATGYLPMPCPRCGHRRLLPTIVVNPPRVVAVACETCETAWPDLDTRKDQA
jgi:transcription elongation factor Elf1